MKVVLEGADELQKKMSEIGLVANQALREAAEAGADTTAGFANQDAPGPNIVFQATKVELGKVEMQIGPDKDHWYYQFFETGAQPHEIKANDGALLFAGDQGETLRKRVQQSGMPAQPFLRPALDKNITEITQAVGNVLRLAIERIAGR